MRQLQYEYAYIFGAVCPSLELQSALILPRVCTESMQEHLDDISKYVPYGRHAAVLMDKAAWHTTKKLNVPKNITIVPLPAASPELNPQEQVWQWLRKNCLSSRVFKNYEEIVDASCNAWKKLTETTGLIKSIATRTWANI